MKIAEIKAKDCPTELEAAADWFLRIRDNELEESDLALWRDWISESDVHALAFDEIVRLWGRFDGIDRLPWPSKGDLRRDRYDGERPINAPTAGSSFRTPRPRRQWVIGGFAALAASLVIALLVPEGNQPDRPIAAVSDNYRTEVAEHREIALPDGSTLHLGALSRVTVTFADLERSITLHEGEALFEVSSDPNRPFVVTAGPNVVRAVGTAFNVKIGLEDITVTVVEGEVSITGPVDETAVEPVAVLEGQSVGYAKTGAVGAVEETDVTLATTWRDGRLTFIGADLESVVADVNRYARQEIVIADRAVRELRFTGTVFHSDIADWLAGLERAFPIRVVDLGERGTLILSESDG